MAEHKNIFRCREKKEIEELRGRMCLQNRDLVNLEVHYKNVARAVNSLNITEFNYFDLGKVFCELSKYFFASGDFLFGMKYLLKAEESEKAELKTWKSKIEARKEKPETWPLYYLYYMHRKYQQRITPLSEVHNRAYQTRTSLEYIRIADRLSEQCLDPLSIKRFEIRAGLFSALVENKVLESAFSKYKELFEDLSRELSRSYGYKKIEKEADDEKVYFLKKIISIFMFEVEHKSFEEYLGDEEIKEWYSRSCEKKRAVENL